MSPLERYEAALRAGSRVDDPGQRAAAQRLDALHRCLDATPGGGPLRQRLAALLGQPKHTATCRGIYLWGTVGRGKTWLMDLLHAARANHDCRRMHFAHFMREVHAKRRLLGTGERPLDQVAAQLAGKARLYCLDEFMVQDIGDAMLLHGVLEGLLQRGVVLVLTSNTPPDRLYEGGLQRERFLPAIALLKRMLDVIDIGVGTDYRRQQLQAAPVYLEAGAAQTPQRMQTLFVQLAGEAGTEEGGHLLVEERPIETVRHAGGLAWFDFTALCEGPRSADDYIALARRLHTLFLSDVPVFDGQNDDAARRFIALIDELYDQRVKLVISAAADPFGLYRGQRLAAAFERTASRLVEMRSAAYLGSERPAPAPRGQ